jgi:hypothetical protein
VKPSECFSYFFHSSSAGDVTAGLDAAFVASLLRGDAIAQEIQLSLVWLGMAHGFVNSVGTLKAATEALKKVSE